MNTVKIRDVELGTGLPKLIIPIVEAEARHIFIQAREYKYRQTDIIEWRADFYHDVLDTDTVLTTAKKLRKILGNIPILFTFRTPSQGGNTTITMEQYHALNRAIIESGYVDAVDLEIDSDEHQGDELIHAAHAHKVAIFGSRNYSDITPDKESILRSMHKIQDLGVDIIKMATMANSPADAIHLMDATQEMKATDANHPIITVAMGANGVITRVAAEAFGSAATYGMVGSASAPGQFPVERLQNAMRILHNGMESTNV